MEQLLLMWVICIVILHIGCMLQAGIRGKRTGWRRELLLILILGYACFGAQLTLFRREAGSRGVMYAYLHMGNLFGDWYERQQFFYAFLNVCFFVPWGFLWGLWRWEDKAWQKNDHDHRVQLSYDCFDRDYPAYDRQRILRSDDIVTNLMGGIMGGILACIVIPFIRYIYRKTTKSVDTVQERRG